MPESTKTRTAEEVLADLKDWLINERYLHERDAKKWVKSYRDRCMAVCKFSDLVLRTIHELEGKS